MSTDPLPEIPAWVLAYFAGRPRGELQAWWDAVCRLYGPDGVRVDFRTMAGTTTGPLSTARAGLDARPGALAV